MKNRNSSPVPKNINAMFEKYSKNLFGPPSKSPKAIAKSSASIKSKVLPLDHSKLSLDFVPSNPQLKLGPGCYPHIPELTPITNTFSRTPRFGYNPTEKVKMLLTHRIITNPEKDRMKVIEKRNRDLKQYSPEAKALRLERSAEMRRSKLSRLSSSKKVMDTRNKQQKLDKMSQKAEKLQIRLKKKEHSVIVKNWVTLISLIGALYVSKCRISSRTKLKQRTDKQWVLIVQVSRVVGKIRVLVHNIRVNRLRNVCIT